MSDETILALTYVRSGPFRSHDEVRQYLREMLCPDVDEGNMGCLPAEIRAAAAELFIARVDCAEIILATGISLIAA